MPHYIPDVTSDYSEVPDQMKEVHRWILWRYEPDGKGGQTKIPYNACNGKKARSTDPATWCNYDVALKAYLELDYSGIGFVLGDGWAGVDLDGCRDPITGELSWGETPTCEGLQPIAIVRSLNGYVEISPSGTGLHVIVRGTLPPGGRQLTVCSNPKRKVEMYDSGRYFTVTGRSIHV